MSDRLEDVILATDERQIHMKAEDGRKIRLRCSAWEDSRVILPDEQVVIRFEHGGIRMIREKRPVPLVGPTTFVAGAPDDEL